MKRFLASAIIMMETVFATLACTSMLVSASASGTGRPLMWKHRDTGTEHNFIERVEGKDGKFGYVALYNGGDSLLAEAWMGMNDAGFAIMNTASYNLAPDTAKVKDREGIVMSEALARCSTVEDFAELLAEMHKPLGVQANFGVMDAFGGMAYFETDDYKYTRFDVADCANGCIIRTNHSITGNDTDGFGYIRMNNTKEILAEEIASGSLTPESFTEKASRSFWHSLLQKDFAEGTDKWVIDQDFIPRNISSASIVIEGINPGMRAEDMVMWTAIGYPPCSVVKIVTLEEVPDELRPLAEGHRSAYCNEVLERKHKTFPLTVGNGQHYIDMEYLRPVMQECHEKSMDAYSSYLRPRQMPKYKITPADIPNTK